MKTVRIDQRIAAAPATVFEVLAHIENFQHAVDDIIGVKFLSETRRGQGTVFEETRKMGSREAKVEMEVTEYTPPTGLRIVSRPDAMGTTWDSHFTIAPDGPNTRLSLEMKAKAAKLLPRIVNTLFAGMIRKAVTKDMESLKRHCESQRETPA
jgi:hypothetical protein